MTGNHGCANRSNSEGRHDDDFRSYREGIELLSRTGKSVTNVNTGIAIAQHVV